MAQVVHAYPKDLAALVQRQWNRVVGTEDPSDLPADQRSHRLPRPGVLADLLSICFQSSLLREEGRPVRFRLIYGEMAGGKNPAGFDGFHILPFAHPLAFTENDARRLAAAASFERALIGVRRRTGGRFEIWGLVDSGADWMRTLEGFRRSFHELPPALVVNVRGPGSLSVAKGSLVVARLFAGRLVTPTPGLLDVPSQDPQEEAVNAVVRTAHLRDRKVRGRSWARVETPFIGQLRSRIGLRVVSAVRSRDHGGTLLLLPAAALNEPRCWAELINIKYILRHGEPRRRMFRQLVRLLEALAIDCGARHGSQHSITWQDYLASNDSAVRAIDEEIMESCQFVASLSAVDGAVVMGQPLELVGFGAEILSQSNPVKNVGRVLDPRRATVALESTLNVGTRHRSAYRICHAIPGLVAVVVSQDGSIRVIRREGARVVYSDQVRTGVMAL